MYSLKIPPKEKKNVILFLLSLLISFNCFAQTQSIPIDFSSNAGYTPGGHEVSNSGASIYSVPFVLSPGTAILEPSLSFVNSSQGGITLSGQGWSVSGFSSIIRTGQQKDIDGITTEVKLNTSDRFSLDGDRLIVNSGFNYGQNQAHYHSEHNLYDIVQSFGNINGSPKYFIVKTKSGLTMEFGRTEDSRNEASGTTTPLSWLVNKIYDNKGNYMKFHYYENNDTGETYPLSIEYTGNENTQLAPYNEVVFEYENRPDITEVYLSGSIQKITKRLIKVKSLHQSEVMRSYQIYYDEVGPSNKSIVTKIQECGKNSDCLSPTTFEYSVDYELKIEKQNNPILPQNKFKGLQILSSGDFNNDGVTDFITQTGVDGNDIRVILGTNNFQSLSSTALQVLPNVLLNNYNLNNSNEYITSQKTIIEIISSAPNIPINFILVGDFNGDGKSDFAISYGIVFRCYISKSEGNNIDFDLYISDINIFLPFTNGITGDFDGNGMEDFILYNKLGINTGYYFAFDQNQLTHSTTSNPLTGISSYYGDLNTSNWKPRLTVNDVNNDGLMDIMIQKSSGGNGITFYKATNSNSFQITIPLAFSNSNQRYLIDVNNDGLPDLIEKDRFGPFGLQTQLICNLNKGNFFFENQESIIVQYPTFFSEEHPTFADVNLDNNIDVLVTRALSTEVWFGVGNGDFESADPLVLHPSDTGLKFNWIPGRYFTTPSVNFLGIREDTTGFHFFAEIYTEPKFLLTKITNGIGQTTEVTYQPTSKDYIYSKSDDFQVSYPQMKYQGALYVVSNVVQSIGNQQIQGQSYLYEDAVIQHNGRGFLGFRKMKIKNVNTNFEEVNIYLLDHRYGGGSLIKSSTYLGDILVSETSTQYDLQHLNNKAFSSNISEVIQKEFDPLSGNLINEITTNYEYDDFGNMLYSEIEYLDGRVETLTNVYFNDSDNWKLGRLLSAKRVVNAPNLPLFEKNSAFEYDDDGLLIKEIVEPNIDTIRLVTEYLRDGYGNITETKVTGWNGIQFETRTNSAVFDNLARFPISTTNQLGYETTFIYDNASGKVLSTTDANGLTVTNEYDNFMRPIKKIFPDGNWMEYGYHFVGQNSLGAVYSTTASDSKGNLAITYLDELDRTVREERINVFDQTVIIDYVYDNRGNVIKESLPYFLGNTPKWIIRKYDIATRLILEINPDGSESSFGYDGLTTELTNELGQKVTSIDDVHGNTFKIIDNLGKVVNKKFDIQNNVIKVSSTQPDLFFQYDIRGLLVKTIDPSAGVTTYYYNAFGEVKEKITPNGITKISYDKLGRPTLRIDGIDTTTFVYDTKFIGNITSINKSDFHIIEFDYDSLGRVIEETKQILDKTFLFKTVYNSIGEIDHFIYPSGIKVSYEYLKGNIIKVKNQQNEFWDLLSEDEFGNPSLYMYGNGVITQKDYDPNRGWLNSTRAWNPNGMLQDWKFNYDALGNLEKQEDRLAGKEERYFYDGLNQLIKSVIPNVDSLILEYNDRGNIIKKSDAGVYYWNDINGQLDSVILHSGVSCSVDVEVEYNSFGKVKTIIRDTNKIEIIYGSDYQRVAQKIWVNNQLERTRYYAGLTELDVKPDGTETEKDYILNGQEIIAIHNHNPISPVTGLLYLHKNHLGSTVALSDASGEIIERFNYDPWGKRRNQDWTKLAKYTSTLTEKGFTGHEHYDLFNVIDMNGRVYDPTLGVFLSPDPFYQSLAFSHLMGKYTYVGNNPLSLIDPSGYFFKKIGRGFKKLGKGAWKGIKKAGSYVKENWKTLVTVAVQTTVMVITSPLGPTISGAAGGFAGGLTGSLLNGCSLKNTLLNVAKQTAIGAANGYLTNVVGHNQFQKGIKGTILGETVRAAGHGVVQGGVSELNGGSFTSGFVSGASSSLTGSGLDALGYNNFAGNLAVSATVGGTTAQLSGGNFANGAMSGAFVYMYNHALKNLAYKGLLVANDFFKGMGDNISFGVTKDFRGYFGLEENIIYKGVHTAGNYTGELTKSLSGNFGTAVSWLQVGRSAVSGDVLGFATGSISNIHGHIPDAFTSSWKGGVASFAIEQSYNLFFDSLIKNNK